LEILARCDSLTGLANRRSVENLIETLWSDGLMARTTIAFVMADIDWFKLLNDTAGHAAGDRCIKNVARAIETAVRPDHDTVCRYGGEEFLIVLTNTTPDLAWALAERIRSSVEALGIANPGVDHSDGSSGVVTISLGVAFAQEGVPPELVAKWADDALYDAKRCGRNVVFMSTAPGADPRPAPPQEGGIADSPVNIAPMIARARSAHPPQNGAASLPAIPEAVAFI
jgi:diguanylate cyclase (GGDEF)-like protein